MRKIASLLLLTVAAVSAAPADDSVPSLPLVGPVSTPWYSGNLNVNDKKALFYVFVQS